jgi:hypothetical protein
MVLKREDVQDKAKVFKEITAAYKQTLKGTWTLDDFNFKKPTPDWVSGVDKTSTVETRLTTHKHATGGVVDSHFDVWLREKTSKGVPVQGPGLAVGELKRG